MSDPMSTDPVPTFNPAPKGLIAMVQAILLKPAQTWDAIEADSTQTVQSIYTGYVIPLALIAPIAFIIGQSVIGTGAFGFSYHMPIIWSVVIAVVNYLLGLVLLYVQALIIDALAPSFDGQKNLLKAFKLAAYSMTAAWLASVFQIIPLLAWLAILGLYSCYLFWIGLPKLMKSPPEKNIVYIIVIIVVTIVASIIPAAIAGTITSIAGLGALSAASHPFGANGDALGGANITVKGADGTTATVNLGQMAAAASQMAAQASATQNGTAAPVKLADPAALLALMPDNFDGAAKSNTSTSSGGAAGMSVATAEATYVIGSGNIHLTVTDTGSLSGFTGIAAAMNVNGSSSSGSSYDKVVSANGQTTDESYDGDSKSGKYSILTGGISVNAEGSGVDIATIKSLVSQVDIGKAQALKH